MKLYESAEDYLETILMLSEELEQVRSVDVANKMSFSKASVSVAMKKLREQNLVEFDSDGGIHLLPKGREIAERIYQKHMAIARFLRQIGVDPVTATQEACKIEHDISEDTFLKLIAHSQAIEEMKNS